MKLLRIFYPLAHGLIAAVVTIGGDYRVGGALFIVTFWCWHFYDQQAAGLTARRNAYREGLEVAFKAVRLSIRAGEIQGSGFDDLAQRNGLIIAANLILSKMEDAK